MDYSNMQLLVTLILDGMLGVLCGWSLRRWLHLEGNGDAETVLQRDLELLQGSAARSCNMLSEAREALAARTAELAEAHASISELQASVSEKAFRVTALELRVAELEPLVAKPLATTRLPGARNMNSSFVRRSRRLATI
jgi:hypothetical protein